MFPRRIFSRATVYFVKHDPDVSILQSKFAVFDAYGHHL